MSSNAYVEGMSKELTALHGSVDRLRRIVDVLPPRQLREPAYPTEWTIADVLSHIGSGAIILAQRFDDVVNGRESDVEFAQSTWDEWNAKEPEDQAADSLEADAALLDRFEALGDEQRTAFQFAIGPLNLDFAGMVALRLNEHVLHTWDIEVIVDPKAVLPEGPTGVVVDNLGMIARFTGRATGSERTVRVRTINPIRDFTIALGADTIEMTPSEPVSRPDLAISSEAFIRLVYGRLDPDHTPPVPNESVLDELRTAFPGV